MLNRVPPLLWIRTFEAAARHENFVAAARELSVTPGAVSRAVRQLEAFLGVALFVRSASGVELTEMARTYARSLTPALRQIALASAEVHAGVRHKTLRVSAIPALAQRWLVPRLGEFHALHPDVTVMIAAETPVLHRAADEFDVALRYGREDHPDYIAIELFEDEIFPVLSPELARDADLRGPEDLFRLTALYDTFWESDWQAWLEAARVPVPKRWRALYFTLYDMAVDAAVSGQGVLIGHSGLIKDELRSGRLIAPFRERIACPERYHAIACRERIETGAVRAFMEWLTTTTKSER